MHYIFDGVKFAKVYINKVLIRSKIAGVRALHKTEKNPECWLKDEKLKIRFMCNRNNIPRRKINTAKWPERYQD